MEVATPLNGARRAVTSLILPAYNAAARAERTWHELRQFLRRAPGDWEILFVCDGCTDGTSALLERLTRGERERVRVLDLRPNRGKGWAVRTGLSAARGRWRLFTDFDLAYGFDDVLHADLVAAQYAQNLQSQRMGDRFEGARGSLDVLLLVDQSVYRLESCRVSHVEAVVLVKRLL